MTDEKIKHLDMIQGVISRMASNSFLIKGWGLTNISALYAFWAIHSNNILILILIAGITIAFWLFDAYFLGLERGFRNLYNDAIKEEKTDFYIVPRRVDNVIKTALTRPVLLFEYLPIFLVTIVILYFKSIQCILNIIKYTLPNI